jgi:CRP-like cAMP-binding protein
MTMLARSSRPSAFAVFRRRNFTLLWIAQLISVAGSALTALAASILVYRLTGTAIVRQGQVSDAAYFLIDGRTVASRQEEDGAERILEVHNAGDFFGEIAALTGVPRTASVLAEQATTVLQVPAMALRKMMGDSQLNRVFLSKLTERMVRMQMVALPGFAGIDQETLRDLRTPETRSVAATEAVPSAA